MESVEMQVKGICEKLNEETIANENHVEQMLIEIANRDYSLKE